MKMTEIKLRSITTELEKLLVKKERAEKKLEKTSAKVEKLDCKWTRDEHSEWLKNVPTENGWIVDKKDVQKNGAWFDWISVQKDLEDIEKSIERTENRLEKAQIAVDEYHAEIEKIEDAKKREEMWKLEFEAEQKEWKKDGITLKTRYSGLTPNGKKFFIYGNCGWTNRSRHCFTLQIDGRTIFTSGEFWRAYMIIKNTK